MTHKRFKTVALSALVIPVVALVGTCGGLTGSKRGKQQESLLAQRVADSDEASEASRVAVDLEERKALLAKLHPGMDLGEVLQQPPLDVMQLPMDERRERIVSGIEAFQVETRDEEWAQQHEARLVSEFSLLTEDAAFHLTQIECRQTLCLLTISWEDPTNGRSAYDKILSTPLGAGCRLEMVPPDEGAIEAQAVLDCADHRKLEAKSIPMVATVQGPIPGE